MRTFSILGDSISTFTGFVPAENHVYYEGERLEGTGVLAVADTWWAKVVDRLGGSLLANASFSGSMVEGAGFPAACSSRRIDQVAGPAGEAPDEAIVFIGINDYGWGGAEAQAAGRSAATPVDLDLSARPERIAGRAPAGAATRFGSAYRAMLSSLRIAYPDTRVWCMTLLPGRAHDLARPSFCYRLRGLDIEDYNKQIRDAARATSCFVADVAALGFDYDASDGTHPTALGMSQLAAMTLAAMDVEEEVRAGGDFASAVDWARADLVMRGAVEEDMTSRRLCDEECCVGCPYARSTGNQWSCVCEKPAPDAAPSIS